MDLYSIFRDHPLISTDTRNIQEGSIFFALRGDQFDGNSFAKDALAKGAAYAVVSDSSITGQPFIHVNDTLQALQDLAHMHRSHFSIPVIGVTGSNGKTTTKELLSSVLSGKFNTHATQGNLNNHIGVPLTLLQLKKEHELLICEMGANHIGEIAALCEIAAPTHGIITNIGKAHLEGFGSIEGVKKAKGELFDYLKNSYGFAFVNADDPALVEISESLTQRLKYALKDDSTADIHFRYIAEKNQPGFMVKDRNSDFQIHSNLFGFYNASNILAAYSAGKHFGVDENLMAQRLSSFVSGANRSERIIWKDCIIIKDAYNANPSSMELALHAFAEQYPYGWVVLGDMKELGPDTAAAHHQIVSKALAEKFSRLFFVGEAFRQAFASLNKKDPRVDVAANVEELKGRWNWNACAGEQLLLKGSRSMHLEKLLE
ncbi:MAG TPA: UDP-N-acetylmuramoyl-tripeptide--D-alanyl-D-alanine ligase [Saprospiraceae bacterium]|nr:UDP-N-acetylmuramoyl-tripeptide--D-alanyl-D-alanine ligase [Saprospiraceae bacterium]